MVVNGKTEKAPSGFTVGFVHSGLMEKNSGATFNVEKFHSEETKTQQLLLPSDSTLNETKF